MVNPNKRVKVFGAALDALDNPLKILSKCAYINRKAQNQLIEGEEYLDPYDILLKRSMELRSDKYVKIGKFPIASWLSPRPEVDDFDALNPKQFQQFVNMGGVYDYVKGLQEYVEKIILPDIPLMIGVDHGLTGGVLKALMKKYGRPNVLIMVFDAHFDAIPADLSLAVANYAKEHQQVIKSLIEPVISEESMNIKNSYSCASFIQYLIDDGVIEPENVIIFGNQDYPDERLRNNPDFRVTEYVSRYLSHKGKGIQFIPGSKSGEKMINSLKSVLNNKSTPYLYISFDVDVAMFKDVLAARFMNAIGIDTTIILNAIDQLVLYMKKRKCQLIGMDIMEIETQVINKTLKKSGRKDKTVQLIDKILKRLF